MTAIKRLGRIKHHRQHLLYIAITLCAGFFIALIAYILLLLFVKSM